MKNLTNEIDHDDLIYYFKNDTATKKVMILIMV